MGERIGIVTSGGDRPGLNAAIRAVVRCAGRGGAPIMVDRVLATRFGVKAYEMVMAKEWGRMAALRDGGMTSVPLEEAAGGTKELDPEILRVIEAISD